MPLVPSRNLPECLLNLRALYPSLPNKHQRIADFILDNPANFLQRDAQEIGRLCGTSDATVVRFCQRVGYTGLDQMKQLLGVEMASALTSGNGAATADSTDRLVNQLIDDCISAIRDTFGHLDLELIYRVVKKIAECERVHVFGSGLSLHLAHEAAEKLMALGFRATAFARPDLQVAAARLAGPKDVVIAVTHSGNYVPTVQALQEAKKRKAYCVALTSFSKSLITKNADTVLYTSPPLRSLKGQSAPRRVAQAILLDMLVVLSARLKKGVGVKKGSGSTRG